MGCAVYDAKICDVAWAYRDVGINGITELDYLFESENTSEFRTHLVRRFPTYQNDINEFFNALGDPGARVDSASDKLETLFDDERKNLLNRLMIQVLKDKFNEWENRSDIPTDVQEQIQKWLQMIYR